MNLSGCYTAIVTPFENGEIHWDTLRRLVNLQIDGGVSGVLPVGTTGESPTLTMSEHKKVIETVIEEVNGRCHVMAGSGGNSTNEAIELTKFAKDAGADSSLQVTPYYNKPTQEGLYRHFSTTADIGLPIILYNIPGRCVVPIDIDTVVRLAEHPNVIVVKEAGGSVDRVSQILNACDITVMSGDDALTLPMMSVGAKGIISVTSNLLPADISKLAQLALDGKWDEAKALHYKLYPVFKNLFSETNPIGIKAAMAMAGLIKEEYRLPMTEMTSGNRNELEASLKAYGAI